MPPAPKAGKVRCKKRRLEVFRQLQAQQQAGGPGQLRVAAEVEVELEGVKHRRQHPHRAAVILPRAEHFVHQHAQHVGNGHHLEQPQRIQPQRPHGARRVKAVLLHKLGDQLPGAGDRPLRHGAEKHQKQRIAQRAFFDLTVAARRVDQIGDGRKAVKADAQRHHDGKRQAQRRFQKTEILEKREDRKAANDAQAHKRFLVRAAAPAKAAPAQV